MAASTRRSGGREPWYPRGTEMRNERQLSIVAADELAHRRARAWGLTEIMPEWIGANLVLDGVPHLSMLPSGTLLFFKGGVTIKIDAQNGPCRDRRPAGRAARPAWPTSRPARCSSRRSPSACAGWWPGSRSPARSGAGEAVSVRVPEQWIYAADRRGQLSPDRIWMKRSATGRIMASAAASSR